MAELVHSCGNYAGFSWMLPISYTRISSPFGYRKHPISGKRKHHNGIDLPAPKNTPIYATRGGTITLRTYHSSAGNYIKIKHPRDPQNSNTHEYVSVYMHMNKFEDGLSVGDEVVQGQLIGYVGTTGSSTGDHLHFGITDNDVPYDEHSGRWVDPVNYIFGKDDPSDSSLESFQSVEKELPKYDDFIPPHINDFITDGFVENLHYRRGLLLKENSVTLLDGNKMNHRIGGGYSNIGLSDSANNLPNIQEESPTINDAMWLSHSVKDSNINPYANIIGGSSLPGNNAYCWGRVYSMLSDYGIQDNINLNSNTSLDWFDYNQYNQIYDYGIIPRTGSVICWTYKDYTNNTIGVEKSYVAFVESVKGTESITVSMMRHNVHGYSSFKNVKDNFSYVNLCNYKNNWGMDPTVYKFRGFIYTLPITYNCDNISQDKGMLISVNNSNPYLSVSLAIRDCKHYNKVRIIYDAEILPPTDSEGNISCDYIDDYCNLYVTFSQQVTSCKSNTDNYGWDKTQLPDTTDKTYLGNPFPKGVILLNSGFTSNVLSDKNFVQDSGSYILNDISETFSLCTYDDGNVVNNVFKGDSESTQYFERTLPGYVTLTIKSLKKIVGSKQYNSRVNVRVKTIILYK